MKKILVAAAALALAAQAFAVETAFKVGVESYTEKCKEPNPLWRMGF